MDLIFIDPTYDNPNFIQGEFCRKLKKEFIEFDNNLIASEGDIGHGADWPVVLIELFKDVDWSSIFKIGAIPGIFLLGKKINDNLDGWFEISKKLKQLFKKQFPDRIDEKAALLIILEDILDTEGQIENIDITLKIHSYDNNLDVNDKLTNRPDSLYIYHIATKKAFYIYGLMSNGSISFKHTYGKFWHDYLEDI